MEDNKIVELFWARSETAITETSRKYSKYCFHISFNILHNNEDAEECVNDTYMNTWNAIPPHRPNRLSTFLGKITRNLSLQKYLKYNAQKRGSGQVDIAISELGDCIPSQTSVEQVIENIDLANTLDMFLRSLSKEARVLFVARYWSLYSILEIAELYDLNENKIKSTLMRTRNKLRKYLEREGIAL